MRMTGDLGMTAGEVHRAAAQVLHFWLETVPPDKRFAKDPALDEEIASRFSALRVAVVADPAPWRADTDTLLAAIILIDQFSRNIFRGGAEAFAADPLARDLARHGIAMGWDVAMDSVHRQFLYLPFMHSEDAEDQALSVRLYTAIGDPELIRFATLHAEQIARFGRYPGRNAALGRADSEEEAAFLSQPGARF